MLFKPKVGPFLHLDEAIRVVRAAATANFDETIDIQVQLGVDPRKPGQNIRGVAQLPHGTGKPVTVAVFAKGEKAEEARRAGATYVGAEDLVEKISKGEIPLTFNKTIATPDVMTLVGKVARLLGPRGLMPNPKLGTVTLAVKEAVSAAKKGQAEFRTEKRGIVMAGVGKASFPLASLRDNLRAFLLAVNDAKPEGLKGTYMRSATLSSTMGVGVTLDMAIVDPASPRFMEPMPVSAGAAAVASAAAAAAGAAPAGAASVAATA